MNIHKNLFFNSQTNRNDQLHSKLYFSLLTCILHLFGIHILIYDVCVIYFHDYKIIVSMKFAMHCFPTYRKTLYLINNITAIICYAIFKILCQLLLQCFQKLQKMLLECNEKLTTKNRNVQFGYLI